MKDNYLHLEYYDRYLFLVMKKQRKRKKQNTFHKININYIIIECAVKSRKKADLSGFLSH